MVEESATAEGEVAATSRLAGDGRGDRRKLDAGARSLTLTMAPANCGATAVRLSL